MISDAELIEIRRRNWRPDAAFRNRRRVVRVGQFSDRAAHDAARVLAVDAAPIIHIEGHRETVRRHISQITFRLKASLPARPGKLRVDLIVYEKAEVVITQPDIYVQMTVEKIHALLQVACDVGDVGMGFGGRAERQAILLLIESEIDLAGLEVAAGD